MINDILYQVFLESFKFYDQSVFFYFTNQYFKRVRAALVFDLGVVLGDVFYCSCLFR
jgi:hypothetical protein